MIHPSVKKFFIHGGPSSTNSCLEAKSPVTTLPPSQVKGLPGKFKTRKQLVDFIAQTLWIVVQHAVVNFPNAEYGQYTAIYPTKVYNDVRAVNWNKMAYTLPGAMTACVSRNEVISFKDQLSILILYALN